MPVDSTGRSRRIGTIAFVAALLVALGVGSVAVAPAGGASATPAESVPATQSAPGTPAQGVFGSVVVEEGETVRDIDGIGGSIVVYGTVAGDVSGLAGTIHVAEGGTVEGSIDAAAGTIRVDGTVGGGVTAGSGHVSVSETGRIGGDVAVGTGHLSVDGTIDGDVRAGAETIVLGPNADVGGEFRYDAADFTRDPGASVGGEVVRDTDLGGGVDLSIPGWVSTVYSLLANLLLGMVLLAVFPRFSRGVAGRVADDPLVSGGVGFLTLVGVPIALVLIAITIVGIPAAIAGAVAYALAIWVGVVYGQYAVGAWVLGLADVENRWLALVVGLVGFAILGLVPILGGILEFVALLLGLGALSLGFVGGYRARRGRARGRQTTLDEVPGEPSAGGRPDES